MERQEYDVAVIGAGPGGYIAAIRAAQLGLKTVCIEKSPTFGGTCLNVGCIPSKALLYSTEQYSWILKKSKENGIVISETHIDFSQMMQRKSKIIEGLTQGITTLFKTCGVFSIQGSAQFISPRTVEVTRGENKTEVAARHFILATGSEPIPLPFLPFDEQQILSSTGALSLPIIPSSLLVVGGGVIGVELASVYQRLGTQVLIVEMLSEICATMDNGLSKSLLQTLKKQGIQFALETKVIQAEKSTSNNEIQITLLGKDKREIWKGEKVLIAVGRRPYTRGLGLDLLGISLNKGYVNVDQNFRTAIPHIYAIGDLIEGPLLAHRASEEGYAVAEQIAGKRVEINYMSIPQVIYTHPEVASVGLTEAEARALSLPLTVSTAYFQANPRARCTGETGGWVKVIGIGKQKQLIGMHIFGNEASELIHTGVIAMQKHMTLEELARTPFAHPTLSEAIKEASNATE
jgi:dihydrolipoamide dehydrogenase